MTYKIADRLHSFFSDPKYTLETSPMWLMLTRMVPGNVRNRRTLLIIMDGREKMEKMPMISTIYYPPEVLSMALAGLIT